MKRVLDVRSLLEYKNIINIIFNSYYNLGFSFNGGDFK